jgi:hypothetical protein
METHLQPLLHLLHVEEVEVVERAVEIPPRPELLRQLLPTVPLHLPFPRPQRADAVAEVVVLLRLLLSKLFRKLPKAHWRRRCRRRAALESSGLRRVRATPSNSPTE